MEIALVLQRQPRACGPAAIAMITGEHYESVCDWFGVDFHKEGIHSPDVHHYLAERGYATAQRKRFIQIGDVRRERENWPPAPSGHVELCHVQVEESSPVTHFVVRRPDGVILDPLLGEITEGLARYFRVDSVSAVQKLEGTYKQ